MKFYMPTKVFAEADCVKKHEKELSAFGKKAMIVTGAHSAKACGAFDDVTSALAENGDEWILFNEVEENPSCETVMKARDLGVSEGVDFVIGIGGGSPMDAAKAIAVMIRHKEEDWLYLYAKELTTDALPVICVPTTCGTGSEVTGISVLTNHQAGTKISMTHRIFPDLALVDGRYLKGLPPHILANTAVDALAHLIESYVTTAADDFSIMCSKRGMELWAKNKDILLGKRQAADDDLTTLMTASAIAGMSIAQSGTALPHMLSYMLTYDLGMPHGKACGFFLSGYLREAPAEMIENVLTWTGFSSVDEMEEFYQAICGRDDVDPEVLRQDAARGLADTARLAKVPYPVTEEVMYRIVGLV